MRNRRQEWRVREEEREMQWATQMIGMSLLQPGQILLNGSKMVCEIHSFLCYMGPVLPYRRRT